MDGPFQQNNMENTPWTHMSQIERNSSYIHAQYRTILKRLHAEIDCLKSANRDLQFQLILLHQTKFAARNTGHSLPASHTSSAGQNNQGRVRNTSNTDSSDQKNNSNATKTHISVQNNHSSDTNIASNSNQNNHDRWTTKINTTSNNTSICCQINNSSDTSRRSHTTTISQTNHQSIGNSNVDRVTKSRSNDASVFNFSQNSLSSGVSSEHKLTTSNQQNESCSDVSSVGSPPTIEQTSTKFDKQDERDYEKDIRPTENSAKQIFTDKPFENTLIENSDFLVSNSDDETSDSPTDKTAEESSTRKPKDKTIRSATNNRPEGNPARDKSTESLAKESHAFELDCTSKHCSLKMRCDECQSYTPLTITKLTPHSKVKSLLNEICSSYNERFANSLNQPENREKQPLATVSQISNHRFSTNQIQDLTAALSLRPSQTQLYPTNSSQLYPSSSQTQLYPTNQNFHTANPNQTLNPIVHKTYVLSIEDTDPHSTNKKIQKTIVWSKRQTGTFESDGISETPCLLPPLQHWQESRCTTTVRQIQPSNTTPTLPEIVTKK